MISIGTRQRISKQLPILCGLLLCAVVIWATEILLRTEQRTAEMSNNIDLRSDLYAIREKVDRSLGSILHGSIGLMAYIEAKSGDLEEQEVLAMLEALHGYSPHVRSYGLAEGTTIRYVYPVAGNEAALGVDYRTVPVQWPQVLAAMNSAEGVLSGPLELIQGGQAFIYRVPVYVHGEYWGLFSTVINVDSYLAEVSSGGMFARGNLSIRSVNGHAEVILLGEAGAFIDPRAQRFDVAIPGGYWQLAMVPKGDSGNPFMMTRRFTGWLIGFALGIGLMVILHQRGALRGLALIDDLTGVANRRQFDLMLDRFCQRYNRRNSGCFALLYLDLDRFKDINDQHGHRAGDFFLKELAKRAEQAIRGGDLLSRWGGDEFAIILDNPTQMSVTHVVERVRSLAEQPVQWRGEQMQVGASIGVVQYPEDGTTADELISVADQKMYANKKARQAQQDT